MPYIVFCDKHGYISKREELDAQAMFKAMEHRVQEQCQDHVWYRETADTDYCSYCDEEFVLDAGSMELQGVACDRCYKRIKKEEELL